MSEAFAMAGTRTEMDVMEPLEGRLDATGKRFAVVAARFNSRIIDPLLSGATDCLRRHGAKAEDIVTVRVPGAWEVPMALEELAVVGGFDALVALAVVIRGETPHFDYICKECSHGVARVTNKYRLPIGFGILTCDNSEQAVERAGGKAGNKGWEAAHAALEMASLVGSIRSLASGEDI